MARTQKNTVDYFPFLCKEGKSMYYIENKYQNDGFATWIKILRQMATTNYHYLDLSLQENWMFLSAKCRVSEQLLLDIINDLCRLGEFDDALWCDKKILISEKFLDSIADAYKKRNNKPPSLTDIRAHLMGLRVLEGYGNSINTPSNTERKEKKTIEKKTIEDYIAEAKLKFDLLLNDTGWVEVCQMQLKVPPEDFAPALAKFFSGLPPTNYQYSEKQLQQHFYYWYNKNKTTWKNESGTKQNANNSVENSHREFTDVNNIAREVLRKLTGA